MKIKVEIIKDYKRTYTEKRKEYGVVVETNVQTIHYRKGMILDPLAETGLCFINELLNEGYAKLIFSEK